MNPRCANRRTYQLSGSDLRKVTSSSAQDAEEDGTEGRVPSEGEGEGESEVIATAVEVLLIMRGR